MARVLERVAGDREARSRRGVALLLVCLYVACLRLGASFERRYASDALAAVVLLGVWLFAANTALLVGYRVPRRRSGS